MVDQDDDDKGWRGGLGDRRDEEGGGYARD